MPENEKYWKINKKLVKNSIYLSLLASIVWVLVIPMYCGDPNRAIVAKILAKSGETRAKITEILAQNPRAEIKLSVDKEFPADLQFGQSESGEAVKIDYKQIDNNGKITIFSSGRNRTTTLKNAESNLVPYYSYGIPAAIW
jgi:hypothetical protein